MAISRVPSLSSTGPAEILLQKRVGVQSEDRDLIERTHSVACNIWDVVSAIIFPIGLLRGIYWVIGEGLAWTVKKIARRYVSRIESRFHNHEKREILLNINDLVFYSEYHRSRSIVLSASTSIEEKKDELAKMRARLQSDPVTEVEELICDPNGDPAQKEESFYQWFCNATENQLQKSIEGLCNAKTTEEKRAAFELMKEDIRDFGILPDSNEINSLLEAFETLTFNNPHEMTGSFDRIWSGPGTTLEKIARISIFPGSIASSPGVIDEIFHNSFWYGPICEDNVVLRTAFQAERKTITTPEGIELQATVFTRNGSDPTKTPTVIYCNANCGFQVDERYRDLMSQSLLSGADCNFITFDYRPVGNPNSTFFNEDDFITDTHSVIEYAKKELKTQNHLIHLYGLSLGGAIAVKTRARHPELGALINDRSFSSIKDVILSHCYTCFKPFGYLAARFVKTKGLAFDAASDLERSNARTLLLFHPEDKVVPLDASIQKVAQERFVKIEMNAIDPKKRMNYHVEKLSSYKDERPDGAARTVLSRIGDFLFQKDMIPSVDRFQPHLIESLERACLQNGIELEAAYTKFVKFFVVKDED